MTKLELASIENVASPSSRPGPFSKRTARLFLGLGLAPGAWALNLGAAYGLVGPAARTNDKTWLYWTAAICAVVAVIGGAVALLELRTLNHDRAPRDAELERARGMARSSWALSIFFFLVIVVQCVPIFFLHLSDH